MNAWLGETEEGVESETMLKSAAELTVTCVQSAVHVPAMSTQTSCEPAVFGVTVKSRLFDSPELMLEITCETVSPVNQFPRSVAVTLDWDWDCWFVTLTVRVPEEPLVIAVVVSEQVYCDDEQALLHAAYDTVTRPVAIIAIAAINIAIFFIKSLRFKPIRRAGHAHC